MPYSDASQLMSRVCHINGTIFAKIAVDMKSVF